MDTTRLRLPSYQLEGVKQVDPLSSVLFNIIVIDHLLRSLPMECGLRFRGGVMRDMAFANDMNLIADTPQCLIDRLTAYLLHCGMKINQAQVPHSIDRWLRQGNEDGS